MDTQISVEMITKQKLTELRREAETSRLLGPGYNDQKERRSIAKRFFAWMFRKPLIRQDQRQIRGGGTARMEGKGHMP